jgi:RNA polymerase sigma-70 factor (ECF subfamily)
MWLFFWTAVTSSPSHPDRATSVAESAGAQPHLVAGTFASEEAQLIARCRTGDLDAFDEVVARHQSRIFNLCHWMMGDRDEAADAAQDAFIRAFRSMPNFRAESSLGTWLHRIAVNVCLDARARRQRAPLPYSSLENNDEDDSRSFDPPDHTDTPEQAAQRHERRQAVLGALATLSDEHRTVLVLFDIEGHSYEDAAQILELPMGTLKSRLNRARLALRRALEQHRELFEG